VLDEFIALDHAFAQNRLDKLAIEELQHWASYLVNVRTVHLSYLTEAETYQLIEAQILVCATTKTLANGY